MKRLKTYLSEGTPEWMKSVQFCYAAGICLGIFGGLGVLFSIL